MVTLPLEPSLAPRRSRLGIALAVLGILLLGGAAFGYRPLAGRALASSSLRALLDRHSDRFRLRWREASSPWPGRILLRGVEITGQTPTLRWRITADRASGTFDALALLGRKIRFRGIEGQGIEVAIERVARKGPRRPARARPWTVELGEIRLDRGKSFQLEKARLIGPWTASGGFRLVFGRTFELFPSRIIWSRGKVTVAGAPALAHFSGRIDARVAPLAPRRDSGWRSFRFVSGTARLSGDLASIEFLAAFLPNLPWMELDSGGGPLRAEVAIDRGRWVAGSFVEVPARRAVIDILQYRVTGACRLGWHVEAERAVARVDVFGAEVGYRDRVRPHLIAPELRLALTTRDLQLDGSLAEFSAEALLPQARAPELSRYNELLPRGSGVEIQEGSGRFRTRLAIDALGRARGTMNLTTSGLRARVNDLDFRGDCHLDLDLASPDVRALRFDLDGSRGRCEGVQVGGRGASDWWLEGKLGDSFAEPRGAEPLHLVATVRARDAEPFLALFGGARGAKIAARLLRAKPFDASGELSLARDAWRVHGRGTAGPKLGLQARLEGREKALAGDLLLRWGPRSLGIELDPRGRSFHWRKAEAWFAAAPTSPAVAKGRRQAP